MTRNQILEAVRRLPAKERRRLVEQIQRSLAEKPGGAKPALPRAKKGHAPKQGPYARTLAASGTGQAVSPDLSSNKYKYVVRAGTDNHHGK